jgi:hypothetical protein
MEKEFWVTTLRTLDDTIGFSRTFLEIIYIVKWRFYFNCL